MNDVRKIKNLLILLSIIFSFAALYLARDLFLPIVIGVLAALTLSPVVRSLSRIGVPEAISAPFLILGTVLALGLGSFLLSNPISQILADGPAMGLELEQKLQGIFASLKEVQDASAKVEELANSGNGKDMVAVQQPGLLAFAAGSIANFMGLAVVGLILAMFLLASGDLFYVKLVEAFPSFSDKRRAIRTARDIERQISHYFLTITVINACLGVCIGVVMFAVGLPNPLLWGVLAFALNYLPFIGGMIGTLLIAAFGVLSFDTLGVGLLPAVLYASITSIEAQFVTPTILGKRLEMNTVSVFLTVIVWSWLWSVPGALMAVPFLVLLKVICDNVPNLNTLGSFLGPKSTKAEL